MASTVMAGLFAAWTWLRPYEWSPDEGARCTVVGSQVKQDHSNYWLTVHLKVREGDQEAMIEHGLPKPVRLLTSSGREIKPADTTRGGADMQTHELWVKFWLEPGDFEGPLKLKLNDGALSIRSGEGLPNLKAAGSRYFVTNRW